MKIETKLEFKTYLKLMYILTYRKPLVIFLTIVGLILIIISGLYFMRISMLFDEPPRLQLAVGIVIVTMLPFSVYRGAKRNFSPDSRLRERTVYEFTDENITINGETFQTVMDWSKTYKILELKNWILIYQNKLAANVLPKSSFGENLNEFIDLIKQQNVRLKLKRR